MKMTANSHVCEILAATSQPSTSGKAERRKRRREDSLAMIKPQRMDGRMHGEGDGVMT